MCLQVDAIQMGIHNICLYTEVDKKYSGSNLKTTELLDCALLRVYAVIRVNMVFTMKVTFCTRESSCGFQFAFQHTKSILNRKGFAPPKR